MIRGLDPYFPHLYPESPTAFTWGVSRMLRHHVTIPMLPGHPSIRAYSQHRSMQGFKCSRY